MPPPESIIVSGDPVNPVTPPAQSKKIKPKAHGAWLGAVSGAGIAQVISGFIATNIVHHALPASTISSLGLICSGVVALLGSYLMPDGQVPPG